MRFKCSMCSNIFESTKQPTSCPACAGQGKVRLKHRIPAKRLTHKQRRQIATLDPVLVAAFREAQAQHPNGKGVQVRVVPDAPRGDDVRPDAVSPEELMKI